MSFAADGLLTVFTVGFVTLTALTVTLRALLLRGAVGLVAVATVINEIHLNSSIIQKKDPLRGLCNKLKQKIPAASFTMYRE